MKVFNSNSYPLLLMELFCTCMYHARFFSLEYLNMMLQRKKNTNRKKDSVVAQMQRLYIPLSHVFSRTFAIYKGLTVTLQDEGLKT